MLYCLNPDCLNPQNPKEVENCQSCGTPLLALIRGRYRIVQPLGQGGFGKTFLAVDDDRLGMRCVIKQFLPQLKGAKALDKAVKLFEQEAIRLHELGEHPHIPTLLAYFEHEQRLYLVQQFIEGATLSQELRQQGTFGDHKIREVLVRLLPLLKFVHDRHVIHRDITPANVIRRAIDGRLVLIDFGVAKLLNEHSATQPGTKIGTEGYAPVEQLRNGKAYPASDLYSLAVTCLHLLTGVQPEDLYDPLSGRWMWRESLAERGAALSGSIGQILDKMLKELVNDRYQSADEAMRDLRMALSTPAVASPIFRGGAVAASTSVTPSAPTDLLPSTLPRSRSADRGSASPPSHPAVALHSPVGAIASPSPFGTAQTYKSLHTLTGHSSWVVSVAISPDSKTLVSGSLDDLIMIWDLASGERLGILRGHTKSVNSLVYSPNGQVVISGSDDGTIKLWRMTDGALLRSLSGHSRDVNAAAVSPDGQFFASGSDDRTVCVWRLATGELLRSYTDMSGMVRSVAISPNGQILASGRLDNQIKIWNLVTGQLLQTLSGHQNSVMSIAISPNGRYLVSGSKDKLIKVWDLTTGAIVRSLSGHLDIVNSVAISPNGKTLISGSNDKTVKVWNLATGEVLSTLAHHANSVNAVATSPDGNYCVSGSSDNTIKVWQMSS
ncbi:protein kinase domain-containing protein [Myxacorys almedinensis]|uniref:Protein kinase n=1 Tax=Myxacorys almedinensis A TaxID=2690445 RepID=A0A8J8CK13_9CYAN|nr:protein kinase [Myxacorys almedinensis]NDJ18126.1 protein kinase [Myxacorys almedinensis A]